MLNSLAIYEKNLTPASKQVLKKKSEILMTIFARRVNGAV